MRLPFQVETMESAQARLQAALETLYDPEECLRSGVYPSSNRRHVFDMDDGLRIIVSRERFSESEQAVHASASFLRDGAFASFLRRDGYIALKEFSERAARRIAVLLGRDTIGEPLLWTPALIPHWYVLAKLGEGVPT